MLLLLPSCLNPVVDPEEANERFKYVHSRVNLVCRWTFSWMFPLLWHGYKTPLDVTVLEKITEEERSQPHADSLHHFINEGKGLLTACLQMNKSLLWRGALYRALADTASLASALSIQWMVKSLKTMLNLDQQPSSLVENPYVVALAILAFGLLQGIFSQVRRIYNRNFPVGS